MLSKKTSSLILLTLLIAGPAAAQVTDTQLDGLTYLIIQAESSGDRLAVGPSGERGLMQIQKKVWTQLSDYPWSDAFISAKNVQVGRALIELINEEYGNKATLARIVYTYNTGKWCRSKHLPRWTQHHPNKIYRQILTEGDNP